MAYENVEQVLDDSLIVFKGFIYLVDNQPQRSPINGTVEELKREFSAREVRRCDIAGRHGILRISADAKVTRTRKIGNMLRPILGFQIW